MYSLPFVSRCGCGSGQSLSLGLVIGMTWVTLTTACTQGFRTRLWDSVPRVSVSRSLWVSVASFVFLHPCPSESFSVSLFLPTFLHLYFVLGHSV